MSVVLFVGCSKKYQSTEKSEQTNQELSKELLGAYAGHQSGFAVKDKNGTEMILRGDKVTIPPSDYRFELGENNIVNLYHINADMIRPDVYRGTYKIVKDDYAQVEIFCQVSLDKYTNPEYYMVIDKMSKTAVINNPREPEIFLTKVK